MNRKTENILIEAAHLAKMSYKIVLSSDVRDIFYKLGRLSNKHKRLCKDYCNIANFDYNKIELVLNKIQREIKKLNNFMISHNLNGYFRVDNQNDPRGLTIKIYFLTGDEKDSILLYDILH